MTALVIDVGGTRTRMALAELDGTRARLESVQVIDTPSGHLDEVIDVYLANRSGVQLTGVAVAAAGRIRRLPGRTSVSLTNTALSIEREALQQRFGTERVWLLNDLAAVAAALPWLTDNELTPLGSPRVAVAGHRLVVGVGTGLGAAALTAKGNVLETEAGHMSLAPVSATERRLLDSLAPLGRCTVEQVLSGPGLLRLYEAVAHQPIADHEELLRRWSADDPPAMRTLRVFCTWLGRSVGDLVLAQGAWGGVTLCGGVVDRLGPALDAKAFREGFEDKAPFSADIASVPVWTVRHPQPALLGLARLALP